MEDFDFAAPVQVIDRGQDKQLKPGHRRLAVVPIPGREIHLVPDDLEIPDVPEEMLAQLSDQSGLDPDAIKMQLEASLHQMRDQRKLVAGTVVDASRVDEHEVGDIVFYGNGRGIQIGGHLMVPADAVIAFDRPNKDDE